MVNILCMVDHMISAITIQLCNYNTRSAKHNMLTNVPIKLYLQTLEEGLIQPLSPSLWIPYIEYTFR